MATKKSSSEKPDKPSGFMAKYKAEVDRIVKRDGLRCVNVNVQVEALELVLAEWYAAWAKKGD